MISPELIKAIIGAVKSCGAGLATIGLTGAGVGVGLVFASLVFKYGRVPSEAKNVFKIAMLIKKLIRNKTIIFVLIIALVCGLDNGIMDGKKNNFKKLLFKIVVVIIVILLTLVVFIYIHTLIEQQQQIDMIENYKSLLAQEIDKINKLKIEMKEEELLNNIKKELLSKTEEELGDKVARWVREIGIMLLFLLQFPDKHTIIAPLLVIIDEGNNIEMFKLCEYVFPNMENIIKYIKNSEITELKNLILTSKKICPEMYVEFFNSVIKYLDEMLLEKSISKDEYNLIKKECVRLSKALLEKDISKIK